jgi:hypothetical protein
VSKALNHVCVRESPASPHRTARPPWARTTAYSALQNLHYTIRRTAPSSPRTHACVGCTQPARGPVSGGSLANLAKCSLAELR